MALDVRNLLCTSGTHSALGHFRPVRNVFDIDSIQFLQAYRNMAVNAAPVGEKSLDGSVEKTGPRRRVRWPAPLGDLLAELQVMRLAKKVAAGGRSFSPLRSRCTTWSGSPPGGAKLTCPGIHQQAAVLAGIQPLATAEEALAAAERRPATGVPEAVVRPHRLGQRACCTSAAGF